MKQKNISSESGFGVIEIMAILLAAGLLCYIAFQVYLNTTRTAADLPRVAYVDLNDSNSKEPEKDEIKWDQHYSLHAIFLAYKLTRQTYPAPTAATWNEIVRISDTKGDIRIKKEDITDPFTDTVYKFTLGTPNFGEIQYRYPSSCDDNQRQFANATSVQSYAFRLKYSDGIRCSSNL
jgi:hypothetical protein